MQTTSMINGMHWHQMRSVACCDDTLTGSPLAETFSYMGSHGKDKDGCIKLDKDRSPKLVPSAHTMLLTELAGQGIGHTLHILAHLSRQPCGREEDHRDVGLHLQGCACSYARWWPHLSSGQRPQ